MVRCNSQTWANNRCNNQIWDNKWDITKWDKTNKMFHRCSSLLFQVTMIATRIQVYLTFYQMELQDICSRLVRKVKLDVFKVERKEENHPLPLIIIMASQVVRLWEKMLWNLMNTRRIHITFNSKLKLTMKMTNLHHKLEIHQESNPELKLVLVTVEKISIWIKILYSKIKREIITF